MTVSQADPQLEAVIIIRPQAGARELHRNIAAVGLWP